YIHGFAGHAPLIMWPGKQEPCSFINKGKHMHRVAVFAAVWALWLPLAHAEEGPKRLSVDISFGVRPDMASLGNTIAQDGTIDTADSTMASLVYSTGKALMSDRNNMAIWHN